MLSKIYSKTIDLIVNHNIDSLAKRQYENSVKVFSIMINSFFFNYLL